MKFRKKLLLGAFFCCHFPCVVLGQIEIVCPLPNAIIQKVSDSGYLRILCRSNNTKNVSLKIADGSGDDISGFGWHDLSFYHNIVDTAFTIPVLGNFTVLWRNLDMSADSGIIPGLAVGHVFGIAGQSNAQGWSYPNYIPPQGDIRMLLYDFAWEIGRDPTGGKWESPWIQMSNTLQKLLNDSLPIGLVNVAVGGTGLATRGSSGYWQRNDALHSDTSTTYGKAMVRFLKAGSRFEAMFWIQGESDAVGVTVVQYDSAFMQLINNFEEDLREPVKIFHLQIGGQNGNPDKYDWGVIRDAQRNLPYSTLVGTAVGAPVGFDGIHYAQSTEIMVGDRFAGTIAKLLHNVLNNLYPPLLPKNFAVLTQCTTGDPYKGYKIVLQCTRGDSPVQLRSLDTLRGFQIRANGQFIDTSNIYGKVETNDPSKIDIFSRDSSFSPKNDLKLSYAINADLSNVNVSDNDTSTTLPNYLVSFMDIPVLASADVSYSFFVSPNVPNPFGWQTSFTVDLIKARSVRYTIYDLEGKNIFSKEEGLLSEGSHLVQITKGHLAPGIYEIVFSIGNDSKTFKIVIL